MEENAEDLKKAINNLIWMYTPGNTKLRTSEKIACDILVMIMQGLTAEGLIDTRGKPSDG